MLKSPLGRSPRDREREHIRRDLTAATSQLVASLRSAPSFPVAPPGAGTEAEGHLGFALGMSGLGGEDWLLPSNAAPGEATRQFNEIK